jgi:hypothetical protein
MQIPAKALLAPSVDAGGSSPAAPRKMLRVDRAAADVRLATQVALDKGGQLLAPNYATWGIAGRCTSPLLIRQDGYQHLGAVVPGKGWAAGAMEQARVLDMEVPCRACSACLRARAYLWGRRAVREWAVGALEARRTWFGSLTFGPEERAFALARADLKLKSNVGVEETVKGARARFAADPFADLEDGNEMLPQLGSEDALPDALLGRRRPAGPGRRAVPQGLAGCSPVERFRALHRELAPTVTKYLKRLRKGNKAEGWAPARFRYLLTVEPHKDWMPHYHIILHEAEMGRSITWEEVNGQWKAGFDKFNLVQTEKAAFYAAKYLGKYAIARVQASSHYGLNPR